MGDAKNMNIFAFDGVDNQILADGKTAASGTQIFIAKAAHKWKLDE